MFWVTTAGVIVVAAGTIISAYMAYLTQKQVRVAVGQLDAAVGQLKATQEQVQLGQQQLQDSEADAVASNKRQDALIAANRIVADSAKAQAEATRQSASAALRAADASIRAADAQRSMAAATEKAVRPKVSLAELHVGGFASEPDKNGKVAITVTWNLKNTGGGSFISKEMEWGIYIGPELPNKMPRGIETPGNDYPIVNSVTSGLNNENHPVTLYIDGFAKAAVMNGRRDVFFYARFDYDDGVTGEPRTKCFGEVVLLDGGASVGHRPSGGAAYRCDERRH